MVEERRGVRPRFFRSSLVFLATFLPLVAVAQDCPQSPTAIDDAATYDGWNPVLVDVLANDIEVDGEAVEVELMGGDCDATASLEHGLLRLDFQPTVAADCEVSYRLRDASDEISSTADIEVKVAITKVFSDTFATGNTSIWSFP